MKNLIKLVFGILVLFVLIYKIGFKDVYHTLINMKLRYFFPILLTEFLAFLISTLSIQLLIMPTKIEITFQKLLRYNILFWALGLFSPARIGEFSLIYFLDKEGIPPGQGAAITMLNRLLSFFTLFAIASIGFFSFFAFKQAIYLFSFLSLILIVSVMFLLSESGRNVIKIYILKKHAQKFEGFSKTLTSYVKEYGLILFLTLLLTTIKWIFHSLAIFYIFVSFDTMVPIPHIVIITAMSVMLSLVPISISGLGVKEIGAVLLYNQINVSTATAVSAYIIINIIEYAIGVSFIVWVAPSEIRAHGNARSYHKVKES